MKKEVPEFRGSWFRRSEPRNPGTRNSGTPHFVEARVSLLKKLFGGKSEPVQRTRVCVECGMPVANHKDWCSILRGQKELEARGTITDAAR